MGPTPNAGPKFNTLFGVTGDAADPWAVGTALDSNYKNEALVETWNGSAYDTGGNRLPLVEVHTDS